VATKTLASNHKAHYQYFIEEKEEAGIALVGSEIKSVRAGRVSLNEAFIRPDNGELWLRNAHIAHYEPSGISGHEPTRPRKLLMHHKQIRYLSGKVAEKGLTIVPLRVYLKGNRAKVEVALAKGKKLYDKREVITRREVERDIRRMVKQ